MFHTKVLEANHIYTVLCMTWGGGYAVAQLVVARRYKPEGRGFDGVTGIFQ
jgi:hypothetical protein